MPDIEKQSILDVLYDLHSRLDVEERNEETQRSILRAREYAEDLYKNALPAQQDNWAAVSQAIDRFEELLAEEDVQALNLLDDLIRTIERLPEQ